MISRLKKDILTQLPPKRRHIVDVKVVDEKLARELRSFDDEVKLPILLSRSDLLRSIKSFEGQKRDHRLVVGGESTNLPSSETAVPLLALPDATGSRKAFLMQLFTKSGVAKIPGILDHLRDFLDDGMSGKV